MRLTSLCVIISSLLCEPVHAQLLRFESWWGVSSMSVQEHRFRPGLSSRAGVVYRADRTRSAIAFEAGALFGFYHFRTQISDYLEIRNRHSAVMISLFAGYKFNERFSLGPEILLQWFTTGNILLYNELSRLRSGYFNQGYDYYSFQPVLSIRSAWFLSKNDRVQLKVQIMQHLSALLASDYDVDKLNLGTQAGYVISSRFRPSHLQMGLSFKLSRAKKEEQREES